MKKSVIISLVLLMGVIFHGNAQITFDVVLDTASQDGKRVLVMTLSNTSKDKTYGFSGKEFLFHENFFYLTDISDTRSMIRDYLYPGYTHFLEPGENHVYKLVLSDKIPNEFILGCSIGCSEYKIPKNINLKKTKGLFGKYRLSKTRIYFEYKRYFWN